MSTVLFVCECESCSCSDQPCKVYAAKPGQKKDVCECEDKSPEPIDWCHGAKYEEQNMTPSIQEKIKGELLVNAGEKKSIQYLISELQTRLAACEDYEFALSRQLEVEPVSSNPPVDLF